MPNLSPAVTRPAPLPGHIKRYVDKYSTTFHARTAVSQVSTAALTDGFNGARNLGFSIDGLIIDFDNAADVAAWLAGINAKLALTAYAGTVVTYDAPNVIVTFSDAIAHTMGNFNPDTPDLALAAFALGTAAVAAPLIRGGMGVVIRDHTLRTCQAPLPGSTYAQFAGVVDRMKTLPNEVLAQWNVPNGCLAQGQDVLSMRKGTAVLQPAAGLTIVAGDPVFMGRIPAESGLFYNADDGGNTRMAITGGMWMAAAATTTSTTGVEAWLA